MKKYYIIILLLISFLLNGYSSPQERFPEHDISIGPSVAYVNSENQHGLSSNFDIGYTYYLFTTSINFKQMKIENKNLYGAQAEFTIWAFLNFGGGYGYLYDQKYEWVSHFFIGLPVGGDIFKIGPFKSQYIEPYYRVNFYKNKKYHEFGILFKMTTFDFQL